MHYIGLMSGTSLDGVDAVLTSVATNVGPLQVLAHVYRPFPHALQQDILDLNSPAHDELHRAALVANAVSRECAAAVCSLLAQAGMVAADVRAIGAHGQTVRHRPGEFDGTGYTIQLLNGALLAEQTGVDVVCDFRSRDVAAGGQGAPLVPAFHAAMFSKARHNLAVLNLGGMANLTLLDGSGGIRGFDCGPGNALMDHWNQQHRGTAFDAGGQWAATGLVLPQLMAELLSEPFLHKAPPKSTGRDLFNAPWLASKLTPGAQPTTFRPVDVQATLLEFTAVSATQALRQYFPDCTDLLVCGGGALNAQLMHRIAQSLVGIRVRSTDSAGLPAQQVEAAAFAWLAACFTHRQSIPATQITGAKGPRLLGALYPAA